MVDFGKRLKKNRKVELAEPPPPLPKPSGPTVQEMADLYGRPIMAMLENKQHYAVGLFQQLCEIYDDFPRDVFRFYQMMNLLKQWKWIDSRDECEMTPWPGQQQQVRIRRTLYWKL